MATLHITNGDSAAEGLKQAQLGGDVLPWRDILHDGPVPASASWGEFRSVRARFLASRGAGSMEDIEQSFLERDQCVEALGAGDDVTLWFEPDLYDQLQLCEILARFAERDESARPTLTIVPADVLLGPLNASQFGPLYDARRSLREQDIALGGEVWKEITCPDPSSIPKAVSLVEESQPGKRYDADDALTLPHLAPALIRWLEQLPSFENGLNRCEQQICEVLRDGPLMFGDVYKSSHHDREEWPWLGDWSFAWYVQRLGEAEEPLIVSSDGTRVTRKRMESLETAFQSLQVQITEFAYDVLDGTADAVDENGIDRWFGGAHLKTTEHWRWDAMTRLAVSRRSERRRQPRG
jgi:hypothetical protein